MTFLKTQYRLTRPLTSNDGERINRLRTVCGIRDLAFDSESFTITYDASRLHQAAVLAAVRAAGIPAEPLRPIPLGAFDHTGEFRDFTWPTQGLSLVNRYPAQK